MIYLRKEANKYARVSLYLIGMPSTRVLPQHWQA